VKFSVIQKALAPHRECIEELCISHEAFYPYKEGEQMEEELKPMSFQGFESLRSLKIAPVYTFGQETMDIELAPEDEAASKKLREASLGRLPSNLRCYTLCAVGSCPRMNI